MEGNLHLLANPNCLLKKQKKSNHTNDLYIVLQKIYPNYNLHQLNDEVKSNVLIKFDIILKEIVIQDISNKLVQQIFTDVIKEFDNSKY